MKKSFKKLGFVSLATSSVLLGSMNVTDLETYAALQKPSHVFGNYAAKKDGNKSPALEAGGSGKEGNSGSQASQQQAQKPLQATAKKQQNLKAPLLLTAPQRLMMKLIQKAPTPL